MLYLAQISFVMYEYMCDPINGDSIRLVEADSEKEAENKVKKYFEGDKDSEFGTSYSVTGVCLSEVIK